MHRALIKKYNVPTPRYTSYPTVPLWEPAAFTNHHWEESLQELDPQEGISVYIHLPFCESLCTYCGCNTRITKNHKVEERYSEALLKEWQHYIDILGFRPKIKELHLGGGTPTFFSPENLTSLISRLLEMSAPVSHREFSFEGHPNNTTYEHLEALRKLGFSRVSYGIQDFDEKVQITINRVQPYENVRRATLEARLLGYASVNFDLIYGLPYQTEASIEDTIHKVERLMPDRIAFYSYAHVPWLKPGQRSYTKADLPKDEEKRRLYEKGKAMLEAIGYREIGMDHFALPSDSLYQAYQRGEMHRNFMGYTTQKTSSLIGLGCSAISQMPRAFAQNEKKVEAYEAKVNAGEWAFIKGHFHTEEDRIIQKAILDIICKEKLVFSPELIRLLPLENKYQWILMEQEGLLKINQEELQVTPMGKIFIRNICAVLDLRNQRVKQEAPVFSKAI